MRNVDHARVHRNIRGEWKPVRVIVIYNFYVEALHFSYRRYYVNVTPIARV